MGEDHDPMLFMLAADLVRNRVRQDVPAITHVDGTARPQAVDKVSNPDYWNMISHFKALTGVPLVTNTSFNLADEPIVCTAADAARTFARGQGFDLMFAGNLVVAKNEIDLQQCLDPTQLAEV